MAAFMNLKSLTKLEFNRSKFWSSILADLANLDDGPEIPCNEIDEIFSDDDDSEVRNDGFNSDEEAMEVDVKEDENLLQEINLTLVKNHPNNQTLLNDEQHPELQDFLNHTLPILNEHERQMKENGVEKILNTFDKKKIEEQVSCWMKHHSYNKSKKPTTNTKYVKKCCQFNRKYTKAYKKTDSDSDIHNHQDDDDDGYVYDDDDDESFESIDEANYIRQTKKINHNACCSGHKMNLLHRNSEKAIKNNCKIKETKNDNYNRSKGQEHREPNDSFMEYMLWKSQRAAHRAKHQSKTLPSYTRGRNPSKRYCKHLGKNLQHKFDCCNSSEESESDSECKTKTYYETFTRKSIKKVAKRKSSVKIACRHRNNSSLSSSDDSVRQRHKTGSHKEHQPKQKPQCQIKYVADSSMSDWMVEDCAKTAKAKTKMDLIIERTATKAGDSLCTVVSPPSAPISKSLMNKQQEKDINDTLEAIENEDEEIVEIKELKRKTKEGKKTEKGKNTIKQKNAKNAKVEVEEKEKEEGHIQKTNRIKRKNNKKAKHEDTDVEFEKQLQAAIDISKKQYEEEQKLKESSNASNESNAITLMSPTTSKKRKSLAKPKPQPDLTNTMFNASGIIVNSTALPNDSYASQKEFEKSNSLTTTLQIKDQPSSPPVSSTFADFQTPAKQIDASSSSKKEQDSNKISSTSDFAKANRMKSIVVYTPKRDPSFVSNSKDARFTITKEHLASILGKVKAEKFFKYYVGRRVFDANSTVYYKPPEQRSLRMNRSSGSGNGSLLGTAEESESEDDIIENFGKYGELYESTHDS